MQIRDIGSSSCWAICGHTYMRNPGLKLPFSQDMCAMRCPESLLPSCLSTYSVASGSLMCCIVSLPLYCILAHPVGPMGPVRGMRYPRPALTLGPRGADELSHA
jgi:hypothetical protein